VAPPLNFLAAVEAPARATLTGAATHRSYPRDTVLFHGGDDGGTMLVLLAGQVKITVPTERGRDTILGFSGPGELLGEISAVDGGPRSATATALEPVEALGIPRSVFTAVLARDQSVGRALLEVLAARLREADRQRAEYAGLDVIGRVARRLVELADRFGVPVPDGVEVALKLSQQDLAGWTGASREATSKALMTLRSLGWVETRRRRLVIVDLEALRGYAG
jgi:CRP/FNR family transcriptional regulator, cyclic AMP receptor protein